MALVLSHRLSTTNLMRGNDMRGRTRLPAAGSLKVDVVPWAAAEAPLSRQEVPFKVEPLGVESVFQQDLADTLAPLQMIPAGATLPTPNTPTHPPTPHTRPSHSHGHTWIPSLQNIKCDVADLVRLRCCSGGAEAFILVSASAHGSTEGAVPQQRGRPYTSQAEVHLTELRCAALKEPHLAAEDFHQLSPEQVCRGMLTSQ